MLWASLAISKLITWLNTSSKLDLFLSVCFVITTIFVFVGNKKQVKTYISINEIGVEWIEPNNSEKGYTSKPILLEWPELRRIKFENNGVSLYQESSFNNFISLKNLTDLDRISCTNEIVTIANIHSIEIIQ